MIVATVKVCSTPGIYFSWLEVQFLFEKLALRLLLFVGFSIRKSGTPSIVLATQQAARGNRDAHRTSIRPAPGTMTLSPMVLDTVSTLLCCSALVFVACDTSLCSFPSVQVVQQNTEGYFARRPTMAVTNVFVVRLVSKLISISASNSRTLSIGKFLSCETTPQRTLLARDCSHCSV